MFVVMVQRWGLVGFFMQRLGVWFGRAGVQARQQERGMVAAKLYYFSFFAAIGAIAPYFNIYLQQRGL